MIFPPESFSFKRTCGEMIRSCSAEVIQVPRIFLTKSVAPVIWLCAEDLFRGTEWKEEGSLDPLKLRCTCCVQVSFSGHEERDLGAKKYNGLGFRSDR